MPQKVTTSRKKPVDCLNLVRYPVLVSFVRQTSNAELGKMMKKRAVAYLRKSTRGQKLSFSLQERWIADFCESFDYEIVETFTDEKSGRTNDRDGLLSALAYINQPEFHDVYLIVGRIDRIARNLSSISYLEPILPRIRSTNLGDTEINDVILACLLSISKAESNAISARVKASYRALKERDPNYTWGSRKGLIEGRNKSLEKRKNRGLDKSSKLLKLIRLIDPNDQFTWRQKAEKLNELGITSPTGKKLTHSSLYGAIKRLENAAC